MENKNETVIKIAEGVVLTDNEIIAEFMDGFRLKIPRNMWYIRSRNETIDSNNMKYNSSWDWLMPVVERIKIKYVVNPKLNENYFRSVLDSKVTTSIEILHQRVVRFIRWYNSQRGGGNFNNSARP